MRASEIRELLKLVEQPGIVSFEIAAQDLRYGLRSLRRNPG